MQCGKAGTCLGKGSGNVLYPLSLAREEKTAIKSASKNGVRIKKIMFLGFLKVSIKFLYISSQVCPKNPKGSVAW